MAEIRREQQGDEGGIRNVNELAFNQPVEALLVDTIRRRHAGLLSLVAVEDSAIVGHILFSPVTIEADGRTVCGMGLAPMAVLPAFQRRGIGSQLVNAGISALRNRGCPFIVVIGHHGYYPRFGFKPSVRHGIRSEWDVPENAFMILVLSNNAMEGVTGVARYLPEFGSAL